VTKTQSAGPISCLEHRATRVLHCAIVTTAAVLTFPLLLQTIISNQMRPSSTFTLDDSSNYARIFANRFRSFEYGHRSTVTDDINTTCRLHITRASKPTVIYSRQPTFPSTNYRNSLQNAWTDARTGALSAKVEQRR